MNIIKYAFFIAFAISAVLLIASCAVKRYSIQFTNEACIKPYKGYQYLTCDYLTVFVNGKLVKVPKGFKTNLASIPRALWSFYAPQYTDFVAPAVLHDYLYSNNLLGNRKYADDVFYSALRETGVSVITSLIFWVTVRTFGWSHYGIR